MVIPFLLARIEQRHNLSPGIPICRTEIAAFVTVTPVTTQAQILGKGFPTMFLRNHVINSKIDWMVRFPDTAVFAAIMGTFNYLPAKRSRDICFTQLFSRF